MPVPLKAGIPSAEALAGMRRCLEDLLAALPPGQRRLDVTVSDALARSWIVERVPGLSTPQEVAALAESQMQDIYGDSMEAAGLWTVRVDATPFAEQWPAIALPKALLELLFELAAGKAWSVGQVTTRFVAGVNARHGNPFRRPGAEVFSLESSDGLTIAVRDTSQWRALRTHPPLALLGTELSAMLRRDCLAAGLQAENCRHEKLTRKVSNGKDLRLDFAPARRESSFRVGLGSAMLALVVAASWSLTGDTEAGPPPYQAALPSVEEIRAINAAVDELNFPWGQVLGLVESRIDGSQRITRFEADARAGRLSFQGEARDSSAVLMLPARLQADALVAEARVLSQGPANPAENGGFPIRFTLEVSLQGGSGE
ncbi:MAG: hypothetical protein D3M94_00395 [Rhodocyclales bacterium GT-UBC]|nr:MAG: hypothetical protein D3M94_00395 [Rhodocyclales bacterium GT-UBC]